MAWQSRFAKVLGMPQTSGTAHTPVPHQDAQEEGQLCQGAREREAQERRSARMSDKPAPGKMETKPKKAAGKDKFADKNVQMKGKRRAKGIQAVRG